MWLYYIERRDFGGRELCDGWKILNKKVRIIKFYIQEGKREQFHHFFGDKDSQNKELNLTQAKLFQLELFIRINRSERILNAKRNCMLGY